MATVETVETVELVVQDQAMHCDGCEARIEGTLGKLPGVRTVMADHRSQRVVLTLDPAQTSLSNVLEKLAFIGYRALLASASGPEAEVRPGVQGVQGTFRGRWASLSRTSGACAFVVSCTAMLAASLAGLVGLAGLTVSLSWLEPLNRVLAPLAQPLLLLSLALIVLGLAGRGLPAVSLGVVGSVLAYAGMFLIAGDMSGMPLAPVISAASVPGSMGSMSAPSSMADMSSSAAAAAAVDRTGLAFAVFWAGTAIIALAFAGAYLPRARPWLRTMPR